MNNKKIISFLLAVGVVVSSFSSVTFADVEEDVINAQEKVKDTEKDLADFLVDIEKNKNDRLHENQKQFLEDEMDAKIRSLEEEIDAIETATKDISAAWESATETQIRSIDELKAKLAELGIEYANYASIVNGAQSSLSALGVVTTSYSGSATATSAISSATSFGTTKSSESEAYYAKLKTELKGDKKAMDEAEIARTLSVIQSKTSSGQDTSAQKAWLEKLKSGTAQYASGGINDFTDIAMLHGTKTKPEMVLNNAQSAGLFNFIKGLVGNPQYQPNKTAISNGTTIQNLNITAANGQHLSQLIDEAKTRVRNGFR